MSCVATAVTARGLAAWPTSRVARRAGVHAPRLRASARLGNSSPGGGGGRAIFAGVSASSSPEASSTGDADASSSRPSAPTLRRGSNALQSDEDGAPHVPVLMRQVLECFRDVRLRRYVDGTMGAGGHASALVKNHPEMRVFVGFDVDPLAHALAKPRVTAAAAETRRDGDAPFRFDAVAANFREMRRVLSETPTEAEDDDVDAEAPDGETGRATRALFGDVDGILMDLGVSSMHLDLPERGFSFNDDGPLDMRMGPGAPRSAFDVVNDWPEEALAKILREYGEEKHWRLLARRICEARADAPIKTTHELVAALGKIPGVKGGRSGGVHPATRTFQAIRIAANDELGAIEEAVPAAIDALAPGGRLAIITFHSLEDKIVKTAFRKAAGLIQTQPERPFSAWERQPPPPPKRVALVSRKPVVADAEEVKRNVRARSAKLRVCEKLP